MRVRVPKLGTCTYLLLTYLPGSSIHSYLHTYVWKLRRLLRLFDVKYLVNNRCSLLFVTGIVRPSTACLCNTRIKTRLHLVTKYDG